MPDHLHEDYGTRVRGLAGRRFTRKCGGPGHLYIYKRGEVPRATNTVCSFEVKDLPATIKQLRQNGVQCEQDTMPGLKTVNGIARRDGMESAWFTDPDGNVIAVTIGLAKHAPPTTAIARPRPVLPWPYPWPTCINAFRGVHPGHEPF